MALSSLNALSVAMNAEQDVTVRALKLQLEEKQLALERARMTAEDVRGEERLREATAQTHGAIRAVLDEIHGFRHGPHNGVSLDEIISNGFFAVARAVHR